MEIWLIKSSLELFDSVAFAKGCMILSIILVVLIIYIFIAVQKQK